MNNDPLKNPDNQKNPPRVDEPLRVEAGWLSMSEAAGLVPYSSEYLSLLARKGKLTSKKIGNVWYTTKPILDEYMRKQMIRAQMQNGNLQSVAALVNQTPVSNANTKPLSAQPANSPIESRLDALRSFQRDASEIISHSPNTISNSDLPDFLKEEKDSRVYVAERVLPNADQQVSSLAPVQAKIEKRIEHKQVRNQEVVRSSQPIPVAPKVSDLEQALERVLDKRMGEPSIITVAARPVRSSFKKVFSSGFLITAVVVAIIGLTVFPVPVVFSFFEKSFTVVKEAINDSNTVMGLRPGTHENEILLLDNEGNIAIMGHIETEGQLRSYVQDGIAPIVVDSKTMVKNLNAEYLGGASSTQFTLAYVTANGNVTTENVTFQGDVNVGSTLRVSGAAKLLSSLQVGQDLKVLGSAEFQQLLKVMGPAHFDSLVTMASDMQVRGNLDVRKNITVRGGLEVSGTILGKRGGFSSLGVSGKITSDEIVSDRGSFEVVCINNDCETAWPSYTDSDTNNFIHGSTTIPKTYTSNIFSALQTFVSLVADGVSTDALTAVNSTTTNATSTNLFSTNAYFTNLTAASQTITELLFSNSTGTSATTTNFFSTTASSTNLFSTLGNIGTLISGNLTFTNATGTSATTTSLFSTSGTFANLFGTSADITDLIFNRATGTAATTTNLFSTTASSTNLYSSLLTVGGTGLVVNSNRNVGIGTASPLAPLSIQNDSAQKWLNFLVSGTSVFEGKFSSDNINLLSRSNYDLHLGANDAAVLTIATTTRVGIGTNADDTPDAALEVNVAGGGNDLFMLSSNINTDGDRFIVKNSGNVGIGSTTPLYKLSVEGSSSLGNEARAGYFIATSTTDSVFPLFTFTNATGTSATTTNFFSTTASSTNLFSTNFNLGLGTFGNATGTNLFTTTSSSTNLFSSLLNVGTNALIVNSSGRVGVGTDPSGSVKLNVLGGAVINGQNGGITVATDGNTSLTAGCNAVGGSQGCSAVLEVYGANGSRPSLLLRNGGGAQTQDLLQWQNTSSVAVGAIKPSGSMGIGTTTPNNILDIYSTSKAAIGFSGASGSTYKWTIGEDMADAGKFKISSSTALGTNDRLTIDGNGLVTIGSLLATYSSTTASTISGNAYMPGSGIWNSTGYVGIGTTSPTVKFSVGGNAGDTTGHGYFTGGLGVGTVTTTPGVLETSGNVYVGGSLTIAGSAASSANTGQFQFLAIPTGTGINQGSVYINPASAGTNNVLLGLAVNGTEKVRIDAEGDVQITGLFNSSNTTGTNQFSGNLSVLGNTTFGDATTDTISFTAQAASNLLPSADNTYSLGTPLKRWSNFYATNAFFDSITTASSTEQNLIINSDNATADTEDSALHFERGTEVPNAILKWDSSNDRFDFNDFPVRLQNKLVVSGTASSTFAGPLWITGDTQGTGLRDASLYVNPSSAAANRSLLSVGVNDVERFRIDAEGDTTVEGSLGVENTLFDITEDTLRIDDKLQINGNEIKDSSGTTRFSIGSSNTITGSLLVTGGLTTLSDLVVSGNSTTTHATTTSIFGATGTFTNLFSTTGVITNLSTSNFDVTDLLFTRATGTSATTTNFFSTTASSTNLFSSLLTVGGTGLVVDSSRNVGIGTTTPTYKTDIYGSLRVGNAGSFDHLLFVNSATGRVGMGTSTPSSLVVASTETVLDINSNANPELVLTRTLAATAARASFRISDTEDLRIAVQDGSASSIDALSIDSTTGNVGIGTSSPIAKLQVHENSSATAGVSVTNTLSGSSATDGLLVGYGNSDNAFVWNFENTNMLFATNNTERMRLTNGGKLGIATSTPNNILDIYDTSKAAIGFSGASGSTYKWTMGMDVSDAGKFKISSSTALGTSDRFVIDGNGNVGIGASTINNKLTVGGKADFNTTFVPSTPTIVVGGNPVTTVQGGSAGDSTLLIKTNDNNVSNGTALEFGWGANQNGAGSRIVSTVASTVGADMFFQTGASTGGNYTTRMTILTGGNVGIGTTTPNKSLSVRTTTGSGFDLTHASVAHGITNELNTDAFFYLRDMNGAEGGADLLGASDVGTLGGIQLRGIIGSSDPTDSVPAVLIEGSKANGASRQSLGALETVFKLRNGVSTNILTALGSGNVGIGTTTPGSLLTLDSTTFPRIRLAKSGVERAQFAFSSLITDALDLTTLSTDPIVFGTNSIERVRIDSSGNVGIGTSTPWGKLSVTNTGSDPSFVVEDAASPDASPFLINASGNVGIGTASPDEALTLGTSKNLKLQQNSKIIWNTIDAIFQANFNSPRFEYHGSGGELWAFERNGNDIVWDGASQNSGYSLTLDSDDDIYFRSNGSNRMLIDSSGKVGIGTTTPYSKFVVWGSDTSASTRSFEVVSNASTTLFSVNNGGLVSLGNLLATSSTTLQNFTFVNATGTSATSTNFFSTTASSTNLFSTNFNLGVGTLGNATSTNFFSTTASSTNLFSTAFNLGSGSLGSLTASSITNSGLTLGRVVFATTSGLLADSSALTFNSTSGTLTTTYASTTALTTSGSAYFAISAGSVGVGTESPLAKFTVEKSNAGTSVGDGVVIRAQSANGLNARSEIGFTYSTSPGTTPPVIIGYQNKENNGYTKGSFYIATRDVTTDTAPTQRLTVSSDGKVGIGVEPTTAELHVSGGGYFTGGLGVGDTNITSGVVNAGTGFRIGNAAASGNVLRGNGTNFVSTASGALTKVDDSNVTLTLGGSPTTALLDAVSISVGWSGQLPVGRGGTGAATFTTNGVLYGNATAAIQATSQGGANTILTANNGAPSFSASPTIGTSVTTPLVIGGTGAASTLTLRSTSGVGGDGADIIFQTGNNGATEAVRVLNSGRVGIGTAAPISPLTVEKATTSTTVGEGVLARFQGANAANSRSEVGFSYFSSSGVYAPVVMGYQPTAYSGYTKGPFYIATRDVTTDTSPSTRFTVMPDGSVGIGHDSPTDKLNVQGTVVAQSFTATSTSVVSSFQQLTATNATTTNFFSTTASSTNLFSSNATLTDLIFTRATGTSATTTSLFSTTASSTNLFSSLLTVGGTGLVVDSSRKVGIGTTPASGYALDIKGGTGLATIRFAGPEDSGPRFHLTRTDASITAADEIAGIEFNHGDTGDRYAFIQTLASTITNGSEIGQLNFKTLDAGAEDTRLTIKGSNVGIGTTSPWGKLSVTNTGSDPSFVVEDAASPDSTLFLIDASGNVGIGTTTPTRKLDVQQADAQPAINISEVSTANRRASLGLGYTAAGTSGWIVGQSLGQNTTKDFFIYDASAASSRLLIDVSGNVGIGTTTPSAALDVVNGGVFRLSSNMTNTTSKDAYIQMAHLTSATEEDFLLLSGASQSGVNRVFLGGGRSGRNAATSLEFYTAADQNTLIGSERMRIDSSGNVGIGTTTSTARLSVQGTLNTEAVIRVTNVGSSSNTAGGGIQLVHNDGAAMAADDRLGFAVFGGATGTNNAFVFSSAISGRTTEAWTTSAAGSALDFEVTPNGSVTRATAMRLDQSGYLGIGTTTPSANLQIGSLAGSIMTGVFGGTIKGLSATGGTVGRLALSGTTQADILLEDIDATANLKLSQLVNIGGKTLLRSFDDAIAVTYNGLVFDHSNGFVGIGTTSPLDKLHVAGTSGASTGQMRFTSTASGHASGDGFQVGIDSNAFVWNYENTALRFATNNTEQMKITEGGLVGIGSTTPFAQLAVENIGSGLSFAVNDQANDSSPFVIDASGNVGIGTTTMASSLLHVHKAAGSAALNISTITSGNASLNFDVAEADFSGSNYWQIVADRTSSDLQFWGHNDYRMVITDGGNVGIGTTTPLSKLAVSGGATIGANYNIAAPTNGLLVEGYVGIGTTSPAYNLEVSSTAGDYTASFVNRGGVHSRGVIIQVPGDGSGDNTALRINKTSGGTQTVLNVDGFSKSGYITGSWGVATTTNFTGTLEVLGAGTYAGAFFGTGTHGRGVLVQVTGDGSGDNTAFRINKTSGGLKTLLDLNGWNETAYFNLTGNLGVGSTTPFGKLSVENTGTDRSFVVNDEASDATPFVIDASGNVGIGTTTPTSLVQMAGATGARLTLSDMGQTLKHWFIESDDEYFKIGTTSDALVTNTSYRPFVIDSAGDIGIGTGNPTSVVHALRNQSGDSRFMLTNAHTGTAAEANIYVGNDDTTASGAFMGAGGTSMTTAGGFLQDGAWFGAGSSASGGLSIMTRSNSPIRFYTNGHTNERMRITEDGNVGIGVTPASVAKLEVKTGTNERLLVRSGTAFSTTGVALDVLTDADATAPLTLRGSAVSVRVGSSANYGLHVNSSGHLLVGTSTMSNRLSVAGPGSNAVYAAYIDHSGTTGAGAGYGLRVSAGDSSNVLQLDRQGTYPILSVTTGSGTTLNGPGSNSVYALTIDHTQTTTGAGSGYGLKVNGSTDAGSTVLSVEGDSTSYLKIVGGGTIGMSSSTPFGKLGLENTGTARSFVVNDEASDATPFVIDASGNVGVGTTTPTAKLSVKGDGTTTGRAFAISDSANAEKLTVLDSGATTLAGTFTVSGTNAVSFGGNVTIGANGAGATNNNLYLTATDTFLRRNTAAMELHADDGSGRFDFYTSGTEKMRLTTAGNLGIGTTTPAGKVTIAAAGSHLTYTDTDNSKQWWTIVDGNADLGFGEDSIATANTRLTLKAGGNVGIGTTTPVSELTIVGANAGMTELSLLDSSGTLAGFQIRYDDATGATYLDNRYDDAAGDIYFRTKTNGTPVNALFIESGGNVGIGTTTPFGLFAVEQGTETNSVWVANTGSSTPSFMVSGTNGNGRVGIATTTPWRTFSVNGTVALAGLTSSGTTDVALCLNSNTSEVISNGSGSCGGASSIRFKHDVTTLEGNLDKVRSLRPVSYISNEYDQANIGFIAEEVNLIEPRLVAYERDGITPYGLKYDKFTALLAGAIQELDLDLRQTASSTDLRISEIEISYGERLDQLEMDIENHDAYVLDLGLITLATTTAESASTTMPNVRANLYEVLSYTGMKIGERIAGFVELAAEKFNATLAYVERAFIKDLYIENKLCVEDVCVDKEQLKQMLVNAGGGVYALSQPTTNNQQPTADSSSSTSTEPVADTATSTPSTTEESAETETAEEPEPEAETETAASTESTPTETTFTPLEVVTEPSPTPTS